MALPSSGPISGSQIGAATSTSAPYGLASMASGAGFSSPYKYSQFYNYNGITTNGLLINLDASVAASYPGSGTTWYDLSGNGSNATLVSSPTFSSTTAGGSFTFNGSTQFAYTANGTSGADTSSFTLTVWGKNNGAGSNAMAARGNDSYGAGWNMFVGTSGGGLSSGNIVLTASGTTVTGGNGSVSKSETAWRYVVITWNASTGVLLMYTNGSLDTTFPTTSNRTLRNSSLGLVIARLGSPYAVSVGASALYNRVLSSTEILSNFNNTKAKYGL